MHKHQIVLPDGTELSSGAGCETAIEKVTLTQQVNTGSDLNPGAVCASCLEVSLFAPHGALHLPAGTELVLFETDGAGARTQLGLFAVEKLEYSGPHRCRITAYDRLSRLDCDLSEWLGGLTQWPCTLQSFARQVCEACGLNLSTEEIPNGDWEIRKFAAADVTGRMLMQWICEAAGRFCRATARGDIELAWYTATGIGLEPAGTHFYYGGSLLADAAPIAPIDRVELRFTGSDAGVSFGSGSNACCITGNPLLLSDSEAALETVAEVLYEILHTQPYTPCRVTVPASLGVQAGDIVDITDANGKSCTAYVMRCVRSGQRTQLACTGNPTRGSTGARNRAKFTSLSGKVTELELGLNGLALESKELDGKMLTLQAGMEGLTAAHSDLNGQAAGLALTVDGISSKVSNQQEDLVFVQQQMSAVEQSAEGLRVQVKHIMESGTERVTTSAGYTFDENGLTVRKSGREFKTQITEDGMTVYKNDRAVLTASSGGVEAVDLHAATYLSVAQRVRFEKYKDTRIGCFWIGG